MVADLAALWKPPTEYAANNMETFPAGFGLPETSLSGDTDPNTIRTQMDSGATRQRRRFTVERLFVRASWEWSDNEFGVWCAWHKFKINLGADWFIMDLPLGGGVEPHIVRLVDGKFSQQYVPVSYVRVSTTLEVKERVTYSEDVLAFYLDLGFSETAIQNLLASANAFHVFLHETYPPLQS